MKKQNFKKMEREAYKAELQKLLKKLNETEPGTEAYETVLSEITALKNQNKSIKDYSGIIAAIIGAIATLAEIGLVMNHERLNVITTKAFGFIHKPKI